MHFIYTFYTLYLCTYILYIYTLEVYVDLICEPRVKFIKPSVCSKYIWFQVWAFFRTSAKLKKYNLFLKGRLLPYFSSSEFNDDDIFLEI